MADFATDTEGTFRPERIMEIAERFGGASAKSVLDLVLINQSTLIKLARISLTLELQIVR